MTDSTTAIVPSGHNEPAAPLRDGEVLASCTKCAAEFLYDPKNHRCEGEWEAMCADAGVPSMFDPHAGMSWVEEQMTKQNSPRSQR